MSVDLRALFAAIVERDRRRVGRAIADQPELVRGGLGRADEAFLDAIARQTYAGDTALHVAAATHWPDGVELLVKAGADVGARNRHAQTPLHYACSGGPGRSGWDAKAQAATIGALLAAGAEVDARAKSEITPLHTAVRNRCALAVEALLAGGADVRAKTKGGSTAAKLATVTTGRGGSGSDAAKAEQARIAALLAGRPSASRTTR